MLYYVVLYMKDGSIHLKPYKNKEEAEVIKEKAINKFGKDLDRAKIVKKDVNSPWWKQVKGYWI